MGLVERRYKNSGNLQYYYSTPGMSVEEVFTVFQGVEVHQLHDLLVAGRPEQKPLPKLGDVGDDFQLGKQLGTPSG